MCLAFPRIYSEGKKFFVPKILKTHLVADRIALLRFDPVNPTTTMLERYGHFTDDWAPDAIEEMTLAFCTHFNPAVNC